MSSNAPWNGWYHINGNTYGTWLRGDPRGWRARHHREHVEGDYKRPPPAGTHEGLHAYSKKLMARAGRSPIRFDDEARELAVLTMVDSLLAHSVELVVASVDDHHYHMLARFANARSLSHVAHGLQPRCIKDPPRHFVGIAKMRATHALISHGFLPIGGAWAKRSKVTPIKNRGHQVATARYIARHAERGASVWAIWNRGGVD